MEGEAELTSWEESSLVIDRLCDQARGQNTAVTCFYFDWAAGKDQSPTWMLGSLLKQMVSRMEMIPEEISRAFEEDKKVIGGRGPQLVDIVKMLQLAASLQPTFICVDGLDECSGAQLVRIIDSLKQILDKSPATRIFLSGRFHIKAQVETALVGQVVNVSIAPTESDVTRYIRAKLREDETPDAMDEILQADILAKVPPRISQM